jgi:aminoglycoside phosphotransferase (APT) family kinase protein
VPLDGGWSGRTYLATAGDLRVVVRRYDEGGRPEVDAAVLRRAAGLVPVPRVLDVRADRLVTSYVEGVRGDLLVPDLDDAGLETMGAEVGAVAATLAATSMPAAGLFVDADLTVTPFDLTLPAWVEVHASAWEGWTDDEVAGLREVASEAEQRLEAVGHTSFVHSDLNPKNLVVDPGTLRIAAVLDWEFAHAGHPFTDLGNAVRFDRRPAWVDAVVTTYGERLGQDPTAAVDLARRADVWALVDLAARRGTNPVADRAHDLLRAVAASRDVHAAP